MTRQCCATMIDTQHRDNRGRMDSELTNDSDHTFEMSPGAPLRTGDSSDVFAMPASDDEKAKIISRRLQELDSAQRSWKKRVAEYVHGLPTDKGHPAEGGRVQDPKRRRLWSTGCERLPWEINSSDGVTPRQRMATASSDSTFSCSQLSTSSSRDSIQHWVDSIDGQEDLDATLTNEDGRRRSSSPHIGRKTSNGSGIHPKVGSQSADDDLGLGADAESVTDSTKGEDLVKTKQVIGPRDKMLKRRLTNSEIISLASQTRALQSRRKQLQRMGSSAVSDKSVASVSDLLFARNDPEELLLSLGFGGQKEPDPLARIPSRFMQGTSTAKGISIENFLMVSESQDQKLGFSLHGGLRGLGAILQNSHYAMGGSVQPQGSSTGGVEGHLGGRIQSIVSGTTSKEHDEVHDIATGMDYLQDRVQDVQRSGWSDLDSKSNEDTRLKNSFNVSSESNLGSKDILDSHESLNSSSKIASDHLLLNRSISIVSSIDSVTSSGSDFYISDSSDSDWDYEDVDPGLGSFRSSEDHRRSRISRMVMPEPLLPPVHEELEVTTAPQSRKSHQIPAQDTNQELNTNETLGSQESSESLSVRKGKDATPGEKKVASLTLDSVPHRLTHTQESFEIEEISSTENQEEGSPVNKSADKVTEKGPLVRSDSAQSDSSGFADEVMESTLVSSSPCFEDCNGHGSTGREYSDDIIPEMGNKLIQTSFDGFSVLESFDRDDWAEESSDAVSGATVVTIDDEKTSNPSSLSSNERIARSRRSFRESRSSYDRMGSTLSGISVSSMEDSPFDGECDIVVPKKVPIPRQRSGTYPPVADKQETPSGPKTIVEILTTLQQNIKQASEAKSFIEAKDSGKSGLKRPTLSKMKTVDLESFPVDDIPSLMESVEAIIGRTKQTPKSTHTSLDQDGDLPNQVESDKEVGHSLAGKVEVVADTIKLSPKLTKRKSCQILRVPTLPCLDEENTPVNSRHSSVSDLLPKLTSTHSTGDHKVPESVTIPDTASSTNEDVESPKLDCVDLRSDTATGESMIANADSIGDLGDLEEEMKYLEHVESLLRQEGRLLDEASPPRSQFQTPNKEPHKPHVEETIVPVTESTNESYQPIIPSDSFIQRVNNNNNSLSSEVGTLFPNHSGDCLNLSDADENFDIAASQIIQNTSSPEPHSPKVAKLVESSMCLYLSPTPFVIDVSQMTCSNDIGADDDLETEHLCKTSDAEIVPKRYRTCVEVDLDAIPSDKKSRKPSETKSISRGKSEDNYQDMKLIQRALFKYKSDLFELESLSERVHARRLHDDDEEEEDGRAMELDSVRGLRRQIMDEVEIMEGQLAIRARQAGARNNFPNEFEGDVRTSSDGSTEVIQEMVKLLEEQRSLRRILNDVEVTHPLTSPSEASTIPDLSAVGSGEWAESGGEEGDGAGDGAGDQGGDYKREMMEALRSLRLEVKQQREAARREMNSAVKEAKDKEIEQLKDLLQEQMLQDRE